MKETKKQDFDQENDQEETNRKHALDQESDQEKKKKNR